MQVHHDEVLEAPEVTRAVESGGLPAGAVPAPEPIAIEIIATGGPDDSDPVEDTAATDKAADEPPDAATEVPEAAEEDEEEEKAPRRRFSLSLPSIGILRFRRRGRSGDDEAEMLPEQTRPQEIPAPQLALANSTAETEPAAADDLPAEAAHVITDPAAAPEAPGPAAPAEAARPVEQPGERFTTLSSLYANLRRNEEPAVVTETAPAPSNGPVDTAAAVEQAALQAEPAPAMSFAPVETAAHIEQATSQAVAVPEAPEPDEAGDALPEQTEDVASDLIIEDEPISDEDLPQLEAPARRSSRFSFGALKSAALRPGARLSMPALRLPKPGDRWRETFDALRRPVTPVSPLYTIAISDTSVRVMVARGNAIQKWAEIRLPEGVVKDGVVAEFASFSAHVSKVLAAVRKDGKIQGQRLAISISGRNVVQRRFPVFETADVTLEQAVLDACAERMAIKPDELQLDWNVQSSGIAAQSDTDDDGKVSSADEEVVRHEVYALGIYRNVVEANLRSLSDARPRFAAVQPKALALAASVNSASGIIVDTEPSGLTVLVLRQGMPEVVREVSIDEGMTPEQWVTAVTTHVSRTVAYYNSLYPDELLESDTPLFLTGVGRTNAGTARDAIVNLPYRPVALPRTMRAPKEFPFAKYSSNVGLALLAGKRLFWHRSPVPILNRPRLEFLPLEYQPRPFPVRGVLSAAMVTGLMVGLGGAFQFTSAAAAETSDMQAELRRYETLAAGRARIIAEQNKQKEAVEGLTRILENKRQRMDYIRGLDGQFAPTFALISGVVPPDVTFEEMDDDGSVVLVTGSGDSYSSLLSYVRLLEAQKPAFKDVRVISLGKQSANAGRPGSSLPQVPGVNLPPGVTLPPGVILPPAGGESPEGEAAPEQSEIKGAYVVELEITRADLEPESASQINPGSGRKPLSERLAPPAPPTSGTVNGQ
jgi:hypothetical protein